MTAAPSRIPAPMHARHGLPLARPTRFGRALLLPASMGAFYFLYFAGGGAYFPYLTLYLQHRHLNGATIGLLTAVMPAVGLVIQPLWGHVADRRGTPVRLIRLLSWAAAGVLLVLPFLGATAALGLGLAAYAAASSPLVGLADSVTLRFLGTHAERYPRVRAWGSASFAITAVASSLMYAGRALWRIFPAMALGLILGTAVLPRREPESRTPMAPAAALPPHRPSPRELLAIPAYVAVVLTTFLLQVANAAHSTFFPVYLVRLHMPPAYLGAPWATAAVIEVPMFSLMPLITRRIGMRWVVLISLVAYALRFFLFASLTVAWPVLLVQAMQGITFTFFTGGTVVLAGSLVPPGLKATGQTVFMGVGFSLAAIVGNLAGGAVVATLGVFWMYRLAAATALAAALGFAAALRPWQGEPAPVQAA